MIEYLDKLVVLLPEDPIQLEIYHAGLLQCMRLKKMHTIVKFPQHLPFMIPYNGRQLEQVPNHQYLHSPKRLIIISIDAAHPKVNSVQNICPQHTYFINDKQFDRSQHLLSGHVQRMSSGQRVLGVEEVALAAKVSLRLSGRKEAAYWE